MLEGTLSLLVLDPGLESRVVDAGRPRSRSLGVPVGGAADRASFALANALVGNPPETAGLEIAVKGPVLRTDADVACAVVGAPFAMRIGSRNLPSNGVFPLRAGEELTISGTPLGMRAYLCVRGGFDVPEILASRSGLTPIRAGDRLPCLSSDTAPWHLSDECPLLAFPSEWRLRTLVGPQADLFQVDAFYSQTFTVSRAANRMGLRLEGTPLPPGREMVSEPVCPGCVQMTREGLPIILGVDGQTIGGYPKIAVVCDAGLDSLGQLRPGDRVRFEQISIAGAGDLLRQRVSLQTEWRTRIELSLAGR